MLQKAFIEKFGMINVFSVALLNKRILFFVFSFICKIINYF